MSKKADKRERENTRRRLARANKKFRALSAKEKRVYIARDVLKQLAAKKLVAERGTWIGTANGGDIRISEEMVKKNVDLQDVLLAQEQCHACALGGLFVSACKIADKMKVSGLDDAKNGGSARIWFQDIKNYMKQFFSVQQLEWIETAFEGVDSLEDEDRDFEYSKDAEDFAKGVYSADDRMKMIMQNIIANKGTFVPRQRPRQVWVMPGFVD